MIIILIMIVMIIDTITTTSTTTTTTSITAITTTIFFFSLSLSFYLSISRSLNFKIFLPCFLSAFSPSYTCIFSFLIIVTFNVFPWSNLYVYFNSFEHSLKHSQVNVFPQLFFVSMFPQPRLYPIYFYYLIFTLAPSLNALDKKEQIYIRLSNYTNRKERSRKMKNLTFLMKIYYISNNLAVNRRKI